MKYLLLPTLLFLCINCDAQKMNYIENIKYLLSLQGRDLTQYKHDKIETLKIEGKKYEGKQFFNVKVPLLPTGTEALMLKYFTSSSLSTKRNLNANTLIYLEKINTETVQLNFYGGWHENIDFNRIDKGTYTPVSKVLEEDFIQFFSKNGWQFKDSIHNRFAESFTFKHRDLELTMLFEVLQDIQDSPFGFEPDISWPEDHIPDLKRFIHFIVRKERIHKLTH